MSHSIIYAPKQNLPVPSDSVLDLKELEQFCISRGVRAKLGKSCLWVYFDEATIHFYKNGGVGFVNLKSLADIEFVDEQLLNFFWVNFARNFVKKEVRSNGSK